MKTNKSESTPELAPDGGLATTSCPPSLFLAAGFPSCSIFGEARHEMAAVCYLEALKYLGDTWQALTPKQVEDACWKCSTNYHMTLDYERMQAVAAVLTSAEDARGFSRVWFHVQNAIALAPLLDSLENSELSQP